MAVGTPPLYQSIYKTNYPYHLANTGILRLMKNNLPSYARLRKNYETAKGLGAPALACNAILVPKGHENLFLLFQNFTRPMPTNNDAATVDYAGGLESHVAGIAKTSFETSITCIETEKGMIHNFAQAIVDNGGFLDQARVIFGASDGTQNAGTKVYDIFDLTPTFGDGGGEFDASSRSQILTVSGSMRYMYFGENSSLGSVGDKAFGTINSALVSGGSGDMSGMIASAIGGLISGINGGGLSNIAIN